MKKAMIKVNRGSDKPFKLFWPDGVDSANGMILTGYTVDGYEVHTALAGHLDLSIVNPTGATKDDPNSWQIEGLINWQEDMPDGTVMSFRVRLTTGSTTITTPEIWVSVV